MKTISHLLDTHAWLWLILGDPRAEEIKNLPDDSIFGIASITLWETILLHQKNRFQLRIPQEEFMDAYTESIGIQVIELSKPIICELLKLPENFRQDPADRMITATALYHQVPLITADRKIIESGIASLAVMKL
jgi:PIN domain nuclease of toxin-antitoxin system